MKKFIVLFAVLAMVFAFAPAAMADVSLYGSARMMTYTVDVDKPGAAKDDTDTAWQLGTLTRFGMKFTGGDVTGLIELDGRAATNNLHHVGDLRYRHAFGEWNFGSGKLLVGKTWPLVNFFVAHLNYTAAGMMFDGGTGAVYARSAQIRLTFGDLKVAFLAPPTHMTNLYTANGERDITLPKIELRYDMKMDNMKFAAAFGYQSYEDVVAATDSGVDVDSYVLGLAGWFNFGAAYLNVGVHYAQNPGPYDLGDRLYMTYSNPALNANQTDTLDVDGFGAVVALGYKVSDTCTVEAGYGMLDYERDAAAGAATTEDTNQSFFLQAKFTLAPGVYVVPEIFIRDQDESKTGGVTTVENETTVIGVWWCINFK